MACFQRTNTDNDYRNIVNQVAPEMKTRHKMLAARCLRWPFVAYRRLFNLGTKFPIKRNGINWLVDLDEAIDLSIFLFGSFEPSTTSALVRLIKPGNTVLDIGANIGNHTLTMAKSVGPRGSVIAFEPTQYAFQKASENLRLNPDFIPFVKLEQIVLTEPGDRSNPGLLYSSWPLVDQKDTHPKHCGATNSTADAKIVSLDEYLQASGISRVDLIKIDVDGYECKVLRGAKGILGASKPTLIMELCPYVLREHGSSLEELIDILRGSQYKLYNEVTEQPIPLDASQLERLIADGSGINAIAK